MHHFRTISTARKGRNFRTIIGGAVEKRGFVGSSPEKYSGVRMSAGSEVGQVVWTEDWMLRFGILQAWGPTPLRSRHRDPRLYRGRVQRASSDVLTTVVVEAIKRGAAAKCGTKRNKENQEGQ